MPRTKSSFRPTTPKHARDFEREAKKIDREIKMLADRALKYRNAAKALRSNPS